MGALPLPLNLLERALDAPTMDLLDPAKVCIRFSCQAGAELLDLTEEPLVPAGQEEAGRAERKGAVWGFSISVGQPLHVTLEAIPLPLSSNCCKA